MSRSLALFRSMVIPAFLAVALGAGVTTEAGAQKVMKSVQVEQMRDILDDMGIEYEQDDDDERPTLRLQMPSGYTAALTLYNDRTDAGLYAAFTGADIDAEDMNEINRKARFVRVYQDLEGDPVIESDLDFVGGVTRDTIKEWILLFDRSAAAFADGL